MPALKNLKSVNESNFYDYVRIPEDHPTESKFQQVSF